MTAASNAQCQCHMQVLVQDKEKINLVSEENTALKLKLQSVETELHSLQEKRKAEATALKTQSHLLQEKRKAETTALKTELHLLQEKRKAESCTWKSHTEDMQVVMKKMKTSAHQLNL